MLNRLVTLARSKHDLDIKKWEIEHKLFLMEQEIEKLEKLNCLSAVKYNKSECLDYQEVKLPDLEARVKRLERVKHDEAFLKIKIALQHCRKEYEPILKKIVVLSDQIVELNRAAREHIPEIRADINKIADENRKIDIISNLSPVFSIKIMMLIFQEIRETNKRELYPALFSLTGIDLIKNPFIEIKLNIDNAIDEIHQTHQKKDISEESMSQLLQSVTKNFWAQVQAKSRKDFNKQAEEVNKINRLLQLELYIAIVLKTYEFADDVQMKSGLSHFRFVILFDARSTLNRFALVNQAAHTILIPENMAAAFAEIRAWLEGLYKHSTDQIPAFLKKPDGTLTEAGFSYITDDENRKLFKYLPPLTKMRLAYNHRLHFLAFPSSPREAVQTVEEEKKQLEQTYDANHVFLAQAAQSEFKSDLTISGFSFICAGKTATATTPVIEAEQQTPAQQPRP